MPVVCQKSRQLHRPSPLLGLRAVGRQERVQQACGLGLGARHQVPVEVERDLDREWPMYCASAFALTPAAIMKLA